jgi:hypothetical protein
MTTPATTASSRGRMGNFVATEAGGGARGDEVEALARTVGEVAMIARESASCWPVSQALTLANFQNGGPRRATSVNARITQQKAAKAGSR